VTKLRWSELDQRTRKALIAASLFDGMLKIAALADLRRRPTRQLRGSKRAWATAITLLNSIGVAPLAYFLLGRRGSNCARGRATEQEPTETS
jgi:hypothetical protein